MKYQVPQFIEVEDRIFGPLTLKQFLYVAGGAALTYILWSILPKFIAVVVCLPVAVFFLALAFYKVNDRPLINTVEYAVKYFFGNKLYIWHKVEKKPTAQKPEEQKIAGQSVELPKLSESKLRELTWSLDIRETLGEDSNNKNNFRV